MISFRGVEELTELTGKKILLRLDLNVPVKNEVVADDFRIKVSLPTLNYLKKSGAKIIILSHIGEAGTETLKPVADYMGLPLLPLKIDESLRSVVDQMQNCDVMMLENLRQDGREVTNNIEFAGELASLADIYVNDAFSVSHRNHASLVALPKLLPSYAGFLLESEIEYLSKLFNPEHPFLFILGGAKFETKIKLVKKFLSIADEIFIGGALSNTVFKEMGFETGISLVDRNGLDLNFLTDDKKITLPVDVAVLCDGNRSIKLPEDIAPHDNMLDVGPETVALLKHRIDESKYVLWNGPLGNYELGFKETTEELARYLSQSSAKTVVGGGDTVAAIRNLGVLDKLSFVSSGGGAMLDFLANGTLPGIEVLSDSFSPQCQAV